MSILAIRHAALFAIRSIIADLWALPGSCMIGAYLKRERTHVGATVVTFF